MPIEHPSYNDRKSYIDRSSIELRPNTYRKTAQHLSNIQRASLEYLSRINRTSSENLYNVCGASFNYICRTTIGRRLIVDPFSTKHLSPIYRPSIEHPSDIYRTTIEYRLTIYRKHIKALSNIYGMSSNQLYGIYGMSVEHRYQVHELETVQSEATWKSIRRALVGTGIASTKSKSVGIRLSIDKKWVS